VAWVGGYFWLPCSACRRPYGGHEWRDVGGHRSSIPDLDDAWSGAGLCPDCTARGIGCHAYARVHGTITHGCLSARRGMAEIGVDVDEITWSWLR
jgi:hypothetical protein